MAIIESSPEGVATWMLERLNAKREIDQASIVGQIARKFGRRLYVYVNDSGNDAIHPKVLAAFNKLSGTGVVWVKSEKLWRFREKGDNKGRSQA
jgi:hypothetical protein